MVFYVACQLFDVMPQLGKKDICSWFMIGYPHCKLVTLLVVESSVLLEYLETATIFLQIHFCSWCVCDILPP